MPELNGQGPGGISQPTGYLAENMTTCDWQNFSKCKGTGVVQRRCRLMHPGVYHNDFEAVLTQLTGTGHPDDSRTNHYDFCRHVSRLSDVQGLNLLQNTCDCASADPSEI